MPGFIRTKEDERLWTKAKARAEDEGKKENWAYITGIYKKMKGGKVAETDPVEELTILALLAEDAALGQGYPSQTKTAKSDAQVLGVPTWGQAVHRVATRYLTAKGVLAPTAFAVPYSKATVVVEAPKKKRAKYPFEGFIDFQGLQVHVENLRGSVRKGVSPEGVPWETPMKHHYGEVEGTEGFDDDPVDVYIGHNADSPLVVVVHQQDPKTKAYDEDKVMLGFDTEEDAIAAYKAQYDGPGFYQSHKSMPIGRFLRWCADKAKRGQKVAKPFPAGSVSDRAGHAPVAESPCRALV